jgi:hypothetical protein
VTCFDFAALDKTILVPIQERSEHMAKGATWIIFGLLAATAPYGSAAARDVNTALPHKRCSLKGTWNNMAGYQYIMTSRRRGTYTPLSCTYYLKISKQTKAGFNVTATSHNKCDSFTEQMTWQGSCTYATGTYTEGGSMGPDSWTYAGPAE